MTLLSFTLHITGGTVALVSGTVAAFVTKGGPLHRTAGNVFFASMLVMAIFAVYLAIAMPGQLLNIFIGVFAFYLVATAWMTVKQKEGVIGWVEKFAMVVALLLCAPFAVLSFQMASGMAPFFRSAVPIKGPVLIALYSFTTVIGVAALADVKVVLAGGISGAPRIARHLWRMCLGLTLAAGSGFTNGVARLLPGPHHVPTILFLPQFLPVILLFFWMIRVRLTGWYAREGAAALGAT